MSAPVRIEPVIWDVVRGNHHFYTMDDCHHGVLTTDAVTGRQTFTGEVGKYRWEATVTFDVPYCSGCDREIPPHGACEWCEVVHADVATAGLTETVSDPLILTLDQMAWRDK